MKLFLLLVCLGLSSLNAYSQSKLINAAKASKVGRTSTTTTPRSKTVTNQDPNAKHLISGYMEISGVNFANTDSEGNIIDDYGANLYASEIKYLAPKFFYKGITSTEKKITLCVKIINENGDIISGETSPEGYSYNHEITVKPGSGQSERLSSWGNNSRNSSYPAGLYKFEIWYNGNILFQKGIRLYSGNTPLINSKTLKIKSVSFGNQDASSNLISDFGKPLYAEEIKYLTPKLFYNGLYSTDQKVTLFTRIFEASGNLSRGKSSPIGFTLKQEVTVKAGENNMILGGWGNKEESIYTEGAYVYELWLDGEKIYETTFSVKKRNTDSIYLTVDSKTAISTSFEPSGGTETFYVQTNSSSWETWGIPSWCEIKNKTATSFSLYCKTNYAAARTDYMKIKTADKEVRIDIFQK